MTILITGATGHLGRLVIDRLIARGADPADLVAGVRTPDKAADLAARGVRVVPLDYDQPITLPAALEGVDRLLLISSSEIGKRVLQHQAVIDAAANAGVDLLAYTSLANVEASSLPLAPEHLASEQAITISDVPAVFLRNNWYADNYVLDLERARVTGELAAGAGDGRVSAAPRADYADAAAAVLLSDNHAGKAYELAGDIALSYDDIAAAIGEVLGREVAYRRLGEAEQRAALEAAGLDADTAGFVASLDRSIATGALESTATTLSELIGRPTTPIVEVLRAAL